MPYRSNEDLPIGLRERLPLHAQDIFREAFNHAWISYAAAGSRQEEIAHRVAWAAVKRHYRKLGDRWVSRSALE